MPPNAPQNTDQASSHRKKYSHPQQKQSLKGRRFDPYITSSRKVFHNTTHSQVSPKQVAYEDSTAEADFHQSPSSNFGVVEQGIGTIFPDAHHFSISGNARIVNIGQNVNNRGINCLDNLKEFVSFNALHDSSVQDPERCCHPGTRRSVLQKMRIWIDNPDAPERILWLHGPAGVGKSAIAQTISYSYSRDKIGATFFFFRSDPTRNDGNRLFPTLAWRLASSIPAFKDVISLSLEDDPDIPRKAIESQFDQLIAQPFLQISAGDPTAPISIRVVIIDGLDECSDLKLQRRILKIIGNAMTDSRFPLRFIISCRPEAHIKDFFSQLNHPTLQIDLTIVDETYRDIKIYLRSEFSRIAVEQELDPKVWPSLDSIDKLVFQSSGQFIYASTIIKYVGDEYESAVAQLTVILGLKPSGGRSPFVELDGLYTEILQRQPDQYFLMEFLLVLVALEADKSLFDAPLLGLDHKELFRKLRGMHSVLKFEHFIDVHHKSFLDYLDDSSRSGKYHVSKHFAKRRYMQLVTDLLVQAASRAMEQPDSHEGDHFKPGFATVIRHFSLFVEFTLNDLEEILQPLLIIQEDLLKLPTMSVPWKPRGCEECWTFDTIDHLLLYLSQLQGTEQIQEPKYVGIRPLTAMEERQSLPQLDLDGCLSLLLAKLRVVESKLSMDVDTIGLIRALVRFDPIATAMKMRSMADGQNLVELIFCLNKNECFESWFGAAAHNATRLAIAIYGRMPLFPQSIFINTAYLNYNRDERTYQGKPIQFRGSDPVWANRHNVLIWGSLSHGNLQPLLGLYSYRDIVVSVVLSPAYGSIRKWRESSNFSFSEIYRIVLEVAKCIQYVHSFNIVLTWYFNMDNIYLDSDNHAKVLGLDFRPIDLYNGHVQYFITLEDNIRWFGDFFYQVLFNASRYVREEPFKVRPGEPEIPENVQQLIQWCCADDPKKRPTMDQVVKELESWMPLG